LKGDLKNITDRNKNTNTETAKRNVSFIETFFEIFAPTNLPRNSKANSNPQYSEAIFISPSIGPIIHFIGPKVLTNRPADKTISNNSFLLINSLKTFLVKFNGEDSSLVLIFFIIQQKAEIFYY